MAPRLVLIGPPGAGKSTIGRLVAGELGEPFTDVDRLIEQRTGREISDIFIEQGEQAFRALERATCAEVCSNATGVVSLGGGAVLDPETEADLRPLRTIFLDVAIADAAGRVGFSQSRPLLALNPRAQWTEMMTGRRPIYARIADARVDTASRAVAEVTAEVIAALTALEAS